MITNRPVGYKRKTCLRGHATAVYFSCNRTTSDVLWVRATARAFPSGDQ